jgi:hypothetical protein
MRRFLRRNGLSVALFGLFGLFVAGQAWTGRIHHNGQRGDHGLPPLGWADYLVSGDFVEAVFENWESEFLQMAIFVLLTACLYQRGSSESNPLPEEEVKPGHAPAADSPVPVHRGGLLLRLYAHSLSLALLALFALSFLLHAVGGLAKANGERALHGTPPLGFWGYLGSARFWFESFQNWQSEFLSVGAIVVLSIFLRERGSSQSKDVAAPRSATGT